MASLVADYGSGSESELDSDDERHRHDSAFALTKSPSEEETKVKRISTEGENLLIGSGGCSSDTSEEETDKCPNQTQTDSTSKLPNPLAMRIPLPAPSLGKKKSKKVDVKYSVFANPFLEAETAKHSILEKHVKMTEDAIQDQKSGKPKKQMCYKFKKGKCQFGSKCKYSHDLDSVPGVMHGDAAEIETAGHAQTGQANTYYGNPPQTFTPVLEDDDSYMSQAKKKRKFGVTDTLQPPKKAQKLLENQRANERPWTMKR
ncbi:uncharacterized protein LOC135482781 [Lineus longissimus]|uniref:uncharacterized protein LOC135482781 n=1 Tax=Lineus longissimus TaxID=88925 RepID=UPI00315D870C